MRRGRAAFPVPPSAALLLRGRLRTAASPIWNVFDDGELRRRSQAFYRDAFGIALDPGEIRCLGGYTEKVCRLCLGCPFRNCCREKGIASCAECASFPCARLAEYRQKYVNRFHQL